MSTSGSTSAGSNTASAAGSSNAGAPLKELPKNNASNKNTGGSSKSDGSQSKTNDAQNAADGNNQPAQSEAGGSDQSAQSAADGSKPAQIASDGGKAQSESENRQSTQEPAGNSQSKKNETTNKQSVQNVTVNESARPEDQPQTESTEDGQVQAQGSEESVSKPAVTMSMDDTTILTPENLQMAKDQNLDLLLKMGRYATWSIDIDSIDMANVSEVDMGVELGTENVPTELIETILDGNKYMEFTLAHDGPFGFEPFLRIVLDPVYEGWYANLFYYNEEAESLEFICDAIIDSDGIAAFDMEHASSYVIIVSPDSMANVSVPGDSGSHAARGIIIALIVCMIAAGAGYGIFLWRRKIQEEEYEETEESEEEYEETEEFEEEYEESEEFEEEYEETEESEEEEYEESGYGEEDDWIEDEDWQEPETPERVLQDKFANDDHAEDDWIDDDEWDISNDWIDDVEWAKRKEA